MSQSRYSPEYKLVARDRTRDAVRALLEADGIRNFADLWKRLVATGGDKVAARRTFQRFYRHGPPQNPHEASYAVLEAISAIGSSPDEIRAAVLGFWSVSASDTTAHGESPEIPRSWFAIVPAQGGRTYASVDQVEIVRQSPIRISGFIRRLAPPADSGHEWHFSGTRLGSLALFLTFWPAGVNNEYSRGNIRLERARGPRARHYEGVYERFDENGGLVSRKLTWQKTIPKSALHRVALLDLDNTLRASWSIRSWVDYLAGEGVRGAEACGQEIEDALERFGDGELDHDELAAHCGSVYAVMLRGKAQDEIRSLAQGFADDGDDLFEFARPLVAWLEENLVSPVIVSGAPHEVVEHYAKRLGIEETFGLTLAIDQAGCYTGEIEQNHGLSTMKSEVVKALNSRQRAIALAIGDSASDRPLWQHARCRIIVGDHPPAPRWPAERVLTIDPDQVRIAEIIDWLSTRLVGSEQEADQQDLIKTLIDQVGRAKSGGSSPS